MPTADSHIAGGPMAAPLAPDHVPVFHNPDTERYVEGCGLVRLDDGTLVAVVPVVPRYVHSRERRASESRSHVLRSADRGRTWQQIAELPYYSAVPWCHDGALYLFANTGGTDYRNDDMLLLRSRDGGASWSPPVTLFHGHYWNCHTGMAIRNGTLYWAVDDLSLGRGYERIGTPPGADRSPRAIACDLGRDPMDPASWRMSNIVAFPKNTEILTNPVFAERSSHYLEPNIIEVAGRIRLLATVKLHGQTTASLCAVFDVADTGGELVLTLTQFAPMPGGQHKFCVIRDDLTGLFWATVNLPADSQLTYDWNDGLTDRIFSSAPGGDDRRFLMLYYGLDGLNWFPAGCIARAQTLAQSFMYPKPVIDGDDLAVIVRSSINAPNRHDADYATFHRVHNFRRWAMDLFPQS